jgi:hypothetical protein
MKYTYKSGDRVAYNHSFLKAVQGDKEIASMRGTVVTCKVLRPNLSLVTVNWDGAEVKKSMSTNLCKVTTKIQDTTE